MNQNSKKRGNTRTVHIVQKRTALLQKLAYIIRPYVVYMLAKTLAQLTFMVLLPFSGAMEWAEQHFNLISAVVNGAASIVAACFVLNDFLIDASRSGEIDIDKGVPGQFILFFKTNFFPDFSGPCKSDGSRDGTEEKSGAKKAFGLALCIVLGITASLALNILVRLATDMMQEQKLLESEQYDAVKTIQYSVPVWLGLVLYGLVSPMVEEMVFRGITYNRIKRFYGIPRAVVCSALLFGIFHGNLPQFVYGSIMGALMAVCYECLNCFAAPVFVHMAANIFTFSVSGMTAWTEKLMTPLWCGVFLLLSGAALAVIGKENAGNKIAEKNLQKNRNL